MNTKVIPLKELTADLEGFLSRWASLFRFLPYLGAWNNRFELTDEWKAELDCRTAELDQSPGKAVPWDVVLAEARARAGR